MIKKEEWRERGREENAKKNGNNCYFIISKNLFLN